jgi:hypothetical protein
MVNVYIYPELNRYFSSTEGLWLFISPSRNTFLSSVPFFRGWGWGILELTHAVTSTWYERSYKQNGVSHENSNNFIEYSNMGGLVSLMSAPFWKEPAPCALKSEINNNPKASEAAVETVSRFYETVSATIYGEI